jgi:hypothetical protein
MRRCLREWRTQRVQAILLESSGLPRMAALRRAPAGKHVAANRPAPQQFAEAFAAVYRAPPTQPRMPSMDWDATRSFPHFTPCELHTALGHIRAGKAPDHDGMVLEMIRHGPVISHECVRALMNAALVSGSFKRSWIHSVLTRLPSKGDMTDVANWRPIAILPTLCNIFSRLLFERLASKLGKACHARTHC